MAFLRTSFGVFEVPDGTEGSMSAEEMMALYPDATLAGGGPILQGTGGGGSQVTPELTGTTEPTISPLQQLETDVTSFIEQLGLDMNDPFQRRIAQEIAAREQQFGTRASQITGGDAQSDLVQSILGFQPSGDVNEFLQNIGIDPNDMDAILQQFGIDPMLLQDPLSLDLAFPEGLSGSGYADEFAFNRGPAGQEGVSSLIGFNPTTRQPIYGSPWDIYDASFGGIPTGPFPGSPGFNEFWQGGDASAQFDPRNLLEFMPFFFDFGGEGLDQYFKEGDRQPPDTRGDGDEPPPFPDIPPPWWPRGMPWPPTGPGDAPHLPAQETILDLFGPGGSNTAEQFGRSVSNLGDVTTQGYVRTLNQVLEPLLTGQSNLLQTAAFAPENLDQYLAGLAGFGGQPQSPLQNMINQLQGSIGQGNPLLQRLNQQLLGGATQLSGQIDPNVQAQNLARDASLRNLLLMSGQDAGGLLGQQAFEGGISPLVSQRNQLATGLFNNLTGNIPLREVSPTPFQGPQTVGTPGIQGNIQDIIRQNLSGVLPQNFVQAQRSRQEEGTRDLLGQLNRLGGGTGALGSGLPAEYLRRNERDFQDRLANLSFQGQQAGIGQGTQLANQMFGQGLQNQQLQQQFRQFGAGQDLISQQLNQAMDLDALTRGGGLTLQALQALGGEARADQGLLQNQAFQLQNLLQNQQQLGGAEARAFQQAPLQFFQAGAGMDQTNLNLLNQLVGREQFLGDFEQQNIFQAQNFLQNLMNILQAPVTAGLSGAFQQSTAGLEGRGDLAAALAEMFRNMG